MKDKIIDYVRINTENGKETSVVDLSMKFEKNKNFISREMNLLVDEGIFFCVQGKTYVYFHKQAFEAENDCEILQKIYSSKQELLNNIAPMEQQDFEKLIGYQDSLAACVEQCKAAIAYPHNSLPVLLNGPTGTGKSYIAQLMYEYARNNQIIDEDKPFVTVNCSEYANNPELLTANLFGHKKGAFTGADKDNIGLIQVANGGVLFLDEVHCLKAECQEKLFLFMDKGIYHKVGENEKWEKSNVRMIFATTEKPEEVLLKTFLRRVPIIVSIPSLKDRGVYERIQLIYTAFMQEAKRIDCKIKISNFVYNMFVNCDFEGNIGELKNTIKVCCANAFAESKNEELQIHMKHLPSTMFNKEIARTKASYEADNRMLAIADLNNEINTDCKAIALYTSILDTIKLDNKSKQFDKCIEYIKEYYDHIVYDQKNVQDSKNSYIMDMIHNILRETIKRYNFKISNNDFLLLFKYIENAAKDPVRIRNWCVLHKDDIIQFKTQALSFMDKELLISDEIIEKVNTEIDIEFDDMFVNLLALNFKMMNQEDNTNNRIGIIIAHGYSTASSIASAANKLLDKYVFDSIDMPIEVTTQQIIEKLNNYLTKMNHYEELVLLVDMGSLEEIYKGINVDINANIGIINNITTKLALQIGNGLINNIPLVSLLKDTCENNYFNYRIIEKKEKDDVILCACASGLGTAEKIKNLLISSLPESLTLNVMTYDYNRLILKDSRQELFEKYNVLCVIGTLNPDIEGLLFFPIEELIVDQDIEILENIFSEYFNKSEIEEFKQKLLKNFSLTNIMDHLTILNPTKLLEHVAKALDDFQQLHEIKIRNNVSVGLYVHTCCMIERLVTHQPFDNYFDVDELQSKHKDFIQNIKKAFLTVESYYGIEIPIDEIGYMYDYIHNNT